MKLRTQKQGFTLVETILYIGVVSLILVAFVSVALSIARSRAKVGVISEVTYNAKHALNIIESHIREADDVITPAEGVTTTSLEVDMPGTPDNIVFDVSGGALRLTDGIASPVAIITNEVTVTSLTFENLAASGEKDNIKIVLTLEYAQPGSMEYEHSNTFTTTVGIRRD